MYDAALAPDVAPGAPSGARQRDVGVIVASLGIVLGLWLPWASIDHFSANAFSTSLPWFLTGRSESGDGSFAHGWLMLAGAVNALLIGLRILPISLRAGWFGVAVLAILALSVWEFSSNDGGLAVLDWIGVGVWVTGGSALALVVISAAGRSSTRAA